MGTLDQNTLLQQQIVDQLKKLNTSADKREQVLDNQRERRTVGTVSKRFETMSKATDEVTKSLKSAEKEFDKSTTSYTKAIKDIVQEALVPGSKAIRDSTKAWKASFEKLVDDQSSDYKNLAKSTRDFIKNNAGATTSIRNTLDVYKGFNVALKQIEDIRRKNDAKNYIATEEVEKSVRQLVASMARLSSGGVKLYGKVTDDIKKLIGSLQNKKEFSATEFKKISAAGVELGESLKVTGEVADGYATGLSKSMTDVRSVLLDGFKSILSNLKTILIVGGRQAISDLQSQAINAVGGSHYVKAAGLGLSEGQLADFIGQNRTALRTMGGGVASAPIANGQIGQLFGKANQFGLIGEDASKLIGTSFNSIMNMGLQPSVKSVSNTMDTLYRTMQETGMTFDQLNDQVAELSKSPAFLQLVQAKGYKGQAEQVEILDKMLKQTGYSADYLKEILEFNKQSRFQGIAEAVKGMIGVQLIGRQLGMSSQDTAIQQELKARGQGGIAQLYANGGYDNKSFSGNYLGKEYKNVRLTDVFGKGAEGGTAFSNYAVNRRNEWNKSEDTYYGNQAASPNLMGGLINKTLLNHWNQLTGSDYQQFDAASQAKAKEMSMYGTLNPLQKQMESITGVNDQLITNLGQVNNAFIPFGKTLNELILNMKQWAEGFLKNPAGQSVTAIGGMFKGIATTAGGLLGLGALKNFLPGSIGKYLPSIGFGAGGGAAGGTVAQSAGRLGRFLPWLGRGLGGLGTGAMTAAGAGGIGGALASTGLVGAAGAAGYGAGSLLDMAPRLFGGQDISTDIAGLFSSNPKMQTFNMANYRNRHGIINGAYPRNPSFNSTASAVDDKNNDMVNKPVVPSGDTMGDLLSTVVTQLTKLNDLTSKQLDLTTDTHQEYMDFLAKQSTDAKVKDARNAANAAHAAGY